MKTLKDIIRKNLNLISEEETIPNIETKLKTQLGNDYTRILKIATEIYYAFKGGMFGGTNVEDLISAIEQINSPSDFTNVNWVYSTYFNSQYPDIATGLSKELEITGSRGRADNLEDFEKIKKHLNNKGVTVSGGWDGKKQVPIVITAPKTTTPPLSPEKKSPYKPDEGELVYRKSLDKSKPSVKPVSNPSTKEIQTLISKTEFADMIKTSKSPDGIDGIWGPKTSRALMGILNSYEQLANKAAETKKGTATT